MLLKIILLALVLAAISPNSFNRHANLEQKPIIPNIINIKGTCSYNGQTITNQINAGFDCGTFTIVDCKFKNNLGLRFSTTGGTVLSFLLSRTSFTNCATSGGHFDSSAVHYKVDSGYTFQLVSPEAYFIKECTFTGCGQAIYMWNYVQPTFPASQISISNMAYMYDPTPNTGSGLDQEAFGYVLGAPPTSFQVDNINYTNSKNVLTRFSYMIAFIRFRYLNIMNVQTRCLFTILTHPVSFDCVNINQIEFNYANPNGTIIKTDKSLTFSNTIIFDLENVDSKVYLLDCTKPRTITFTNCYTTLRKSNIGLSGTLINIDDRYVFDSYGCDVRLTPSTKFSASNIFSASSKFAESKKFSASTKFSATTKFSLSIMFTKTEKFTKSAQFSKSSQFTLSNRFTGSDKFSPSSDFTRSNTFTPSNFFTPSDSKYVYFVRMSKQAKLPPQTSPYGVLSTTAMATVSTSVIITIVIIGGILLILYVRQQKRNMVEPELPDFLQLPSDTSDTTGDCVISFSYSLETASRDCDPFKMDPEYYLSLPRLHIIERD